MHPGQQPDIDLQTVLPSRRQMARVAAVIVIVSLICGLLLAWLVYKTPDSAFALALGNALVTGGSAMFSAPGSALLAVGAGLMWGVGLVFISAFPYTAWLIYRASKGYKDLLMQQKMAAYRRVIAGEDAQ
jgi:hypothetical protein